MSQPTFRLYNTLSREKEVFAPLDPQNVRVYCCGPTVYNYAHVGNARPAVVFDVLFRVLRHVYGAAHVKYVRNITDVDDKILAAAQKTGRDITAITREYEKIYNEDMAALGCLGPTLSPRATEHIPAMIAMITALMAKGHAYAQEGHVLFHVPSMPTYGRLSRKNQEELVAGARVEVAPYKKDPADFVLWKPSAEDQPGWPSPWGRGRPGWHIECSAMSETHLGETFDIHAGGLDLIFPHHENEIAQSSCAHGGQPMARYWLHNGFLTMGDEKMSKSLGNVAYAHDLLKKWPGEVLRLTLLSAHYRQPLVFTEDVLAQSRHALDAGYRALAVHGGARHERGQEEGETTHARAHARAHANTQPLPDSLLDDLNTPAAFRQLQADLSALATAPEPAPLWTRIRTLSRLLGVFQMDPAAWFGWRPEGTVIDEGRVHALINDRLAAKKARNFAEADRLRGELGAMGVALEDTPQGTSWRVKG